MRRRIVNILMVCLLALAACSDVTEIGVTEPGTAGVPLNPGEQEVHLYLKGLGNGGGVPVSRASGVVTLPGENTVEEIVVYCFVNLDTGGSTVTMMGLDSKSDGDASTLERVYHYKAGASDNDLFVASDADGYRISLGVVKDDNKRLFVIHANAGGVATELYNVNLIDFFSITPVAVDADRGLATTYSNFKNSDDLEIPFPLNFTENSPNTVALPVLPPLPMRGTGYREEPLTGGTTREIGWFTSDELAKGISFKLTRATARFDISNPVATGFTVSSIEAKGVTVNREENRQEAVVAFSERALENSELIAGALYLPRTTTKNNTWGSSLQILIKGTLYGVPTTVTVDPADDTAINPNTRYIINILNSGSTLSAKLQVAEWGDGGSGINGEDLLGTLNEAVTVEVPNKDDRDPKADIIGNKISMMWLRHSTVVLEGSSAKPIGVVLPEGVFEEDKISHTLSADNRYVLSLPLDTDIPPFTAPKTSVLKVITHPVDAAEKYYEKYDEYKIVRDWITPSMLKDENISLGLPSVTFGEEAPEGWAVNTTDKTITLSAFAGYGCLTLQNATEYSGWIEEGLGDWLTVEKQVAREQDDPIFQMLYARKDNFKSNERRTSQMVLREWDTAENALKETKYTLIQDAGNWAAAALGTGYDVDISKIFNSGNFVSEVKYEGSTLTYPASDATYNDAAYYISLRSKDEKPIAVDFVSGTSWIRPTFNETINRSGDIDKYVRFFRIEKNTGAARTGTINVTYRDKTTGALKTETITVKQKAV